MLAIAEIIEETHGYPGGSKKIDFFSKFHGQHKELQLVTNKIIQRAGFFRGWTDPSAWS